MLVAPFTSVIALLDLFRNKLVKERLKKHKSVGRRSQGGGHGIGSAVSSKVMAR